MKEKNLYWSIFKCGLFQPNKQRGHPLFQKSGHLLLIGLFIIVVNVLFLSACVEQSAAVEKVNNRILNLVPQQTNQALGAFIEKELPVLGEFTKNIYLLETLAKNPTHQVILFAPADEALSPYLNKVHGLKKRTALLKKGIVLHAKSQGKWEGQATTYGGMAIRISDDESTLFFKDQEVSILKKIQSEDGHLVYIINQLIS